MSVDINSEQQGARVALDDLISAASQGVLRALAARQRLPEKGEGFFVDLQIRVGIPAPVLQTMGSLGSLGAQAGTSVNTSALPGGSATETE